MRDEPTAAPAQIDAGLGGEWLGERVGRRNRLPRYLFAELSGGNDGHLDRLARLWSSFGGWSGGGLGGPGTCSQSYPAGTTVTLTASPAPGSSFGSWSGGGCAGTGTCTVTMSADQSITATFSANPPSPPPADSYSGATSQSVPMSLYVSADSTHVQDVRVPTGLECTPSMTLNDQLLFGSIPIAADGSFSGTATQTGVIDSSTAQFTYTFSGHFHETTTAGVERVAGQHSDVVGDGSMTVKLHYPRRGSPT